MRFLHLIPVFLLAFCLQAQNYAYAVAGLQQAALPTRVEGSVLAFSLSLPTASDWPAEVGIRFLGNRSTSAWQQLLLDEHAPDNRLQSALGYIDYDPAYTHFEVRLPQGMSGLLHLFDPGLTQEGEGALSTLEQQEHACFCSLPDYLGRTDWCPSGLCPQSPNPTITNVTHLIVHHSASPNTSNDWAAVVRSFWNLHVNTNGWDDIGYNYLIDPNGIIYEGRGNDVRGAHFCGKNGNTMGVCVIGDFTNVAPTTAAREALSKLLAWKLCDNSLGGLSETFHIPSNGLLPTIAGHRDGCSTQCPGNTFYPLLAAQRQAAVDTLGACEPTSLEALNEALASLLLTPNPTNGQVKISGLGSGFAQLAIYDVLGRPIAQQNVQNGQWLDLKQLSSAKGVFHFVFSQGQARSVQRLIQQ